MSSYKLCATFSLFILFNYCHAQLCYAQLSDSTFVKISENASVWNRILREVYIDKYLTRLSKDLKPKSVLIQNVNLITMKNDTIRNGWDVLTEGTKIRKVGKGITVPKSYKEVEIIDGTGMYIIPGLTDAHVHIGNSNAEKLLNIATGITTVREMAGAPWMIPYREAINSNQILAPTTYVASPMLNETDLWIYSEIITKPSEATTKVRQFKSIGYDFVKVWNVISNENFQAIAQACKEEKIDLVGHVPHNVKVETALRNNMKTLEHFKGFLNDQTLKLTQENYLNAVVQFSDQSFWLCPTFSLFAEGLRGKSAEEYLASSNGEKYVPAEVKKDWYDKMNNYEFDSQFGNVSDTVFRLSKTIFESLKGQPVNYIAGTDYNGSNLYMVAGFALHNELSIMHDLGMSNFEALKSATTNSSQALGKSHEYGTIEVGKRADFLILKKNPLDNLDNLLGDRIIVVRGIVYNEERIRNILDTIENIYNSNDYVFLNDPVGNLKSLLSHYTDQSNKNLVKPISYFLFSQNLIKAKLYNEALIVMKTAVTNYPEYWMFDQLANVYLLKNEINQAKINFEKSIKLYPAGNTAKSKLEKMKMEN